jgi:hypothetical protein
MAGTTDLSLRHAQGEVFQSKTRFRVLVAGRRFGKSYLSCIELLRAAIDRPGEVYFYCAPTYRMAKDIAWKTLKTLVPQAWVASKNESDLKIELRNGSMIELKGTENAMALRGRSLGGVVLDEAAFMDSGVWFEVLRPALADKQGWALFISTPEGTASWFYDLWNYAAEPESHDWDRWSYTTIEGGNVPAEEVEAARGQLDPRTFRQEFEASFENLSGLVAINFSEENISTIAEDIPQLPLWVGLDFNVDNMSAVCGVRVGDDLHIFHEILMVNATTWDMADELNHHFGLERRKDVCPDPTGAARKTAGVGLTDHAILRKSGHRVSTPRSPWKIRDKVNCVNTAILDGTGTRRLKIHPRCKETIKSLRTLVYDDNGLPNKKLGVDHMFDALGYLCLMKFNLNKGIKIGQSNFKLYGSATR